MKIMLQATTATSSGLKLSLTQGCIDLRVLIRVPWIERAARWIAGVVSALICLAILAAGVAECLDTKGDGISALGLAAAIAVVPGAIAVGCLKGLPRLRRLKGCILVVRASNAELGISQIQPDGHEVLLASWPVTDIHSAGLLPTGMRWTGERLWRLCVRSHRLGLMLAEFYWPRCDELVCVQESLHKILGVRCSEEAHSSGFNVILSPRVA